MWVEGFQAKIQKKKKKNVTLKNNFGLHKMSLELSPKITAGKKFPNLKCRKTEIYVLARNV